METQSGAPRLMEFIQSELTKEEARRASIESRGLAVVTVASGLLAIIAAVRPLGVTAKSAPTAGPLLQGLASTSGVLLVIGVLVAAFTNAPRRYRLIDPEAMSALAPRLWVQDVDDLNRSIFASHLTFLRDAQRINDGRARLLFAATLLVGVGAVLLAASNLYPDL